MGICCGINQGIHGVPPLKIAQTLKILEQSKKNIICKIIKEEEKSMGTGFFCNIFYSEQSYKMPVLITNNHIINEKDIEINQEIGITLDDDKVEKILKINEQRKTYTDKELDITIIEILPSVDEIYSNDFFEIDENAFRNNYEEICKDMKNNVVYILQYPKGEELSYSLGLILSIFDKTIRHSCSTEFGSSGSPILLLSSYRVIGVHKGTTLFNSNEGILIKFPIEEFKKKYAVIGEITKSYINLIEITIENNEEKKDIPIIYNSYSIVNGKIKQKLNTSNIDLYINNNKKNNFESRIKLEKGIYYIKLIFNYEILDCSDLFSYCENIVSLNLSSFNTKKVTNMARMFYGCKNLKNLNLANFSTKNVTDMSYMFSDCTSLMSIDLSSFDINNVENISAMFFKCENLKKVNLSNLSTSNVNNMSFMFFNCKSLISIDLSNFDTKNVNNMCSMFNGCVCLENVNLSSFDTKNVTNMQTMFFLCENLERLNLSNFVTTNVNKYEDIFWGCKNIKEIIINDKLTIDSIKSQIKAVLSKEKTAKKLSDLKH